MTMRTLGIHAVAWTVVFGSVTALTAGQKAVPPSFRERALAAETVNDTPKALAALDEGLKATPNDPGLLAAKGRIYWRLLRTATAEQALLQAVKAPAYRSEAHYWLGRIYYFKGYLAEDAFPGWHEQVSYRPRAVAEFTAARDAKPDWYLPHQALADALKADGKDAEAAAEYAKARTLGAPEPGPDVAEMAAIRSAQQGQQWPVVIEKAKAFVAARPMSPFVMDAYDALLTAYQATPSAPIADVRAAIDARVALRPDPMSYTRGANILLARRADLAHVLELADAGRVAGERFIHENENSYKLDGKVQGSLDRTAAGFADLAGWAYFLQGNRTAAEEKLAEAARLSRNVDATNQTHLGELSRTKGDLETARDHYLNVLTLAGATPPQRDGARAALKDIQAKNGENPAEFDTWLAGTLDRLRDERRKALVSNMVGKPLPRLVATDLQGHPVDLEAERGNVLLLNFFSAW